MFDVKPYLTSRLYALGYYALTVTFLYLSATFFGSRSSVRSSTMTATNSTGRGTSRNTTTHQHEQAADEREREREEAQQARAISVPEPSAFGGTNSSGVSVRRADEGEHEQAAIDARMRR